MANKYTYASQYSGSWAVIIGIDEYLHAPPLGFAANDARAVAQILEARFGFPSEQIALLLNADATSEKIRDAFLRFTSAGTVEDDDRLVVFFAGHGHTVTGKRGEVGFLVPVDGKPSDPRTLIRWDELTRNADLIAAKHVFFVMDACYGGLALQRNPGVGNMRFLGDMVQRYARQVLTAGKADETVADGSGVRPGHSIFTAHLLNALEGAAATAEGVITASGVMAYVYDRVGRDQYSHQTPHYGFVDGDGDLVFDTSLLDVLRAVPAAGADAEAKAAGKGENDILINTSPETDTPSDEPTVVDTMKDLLSDPSKRIRLDDFVAYHVRRFLDATDPRHFSPQDASPSKEEFERRIHAYELAAGDLQRIVILLAKWGEREQLQLLERIFIRLAEADKGRAGTVLWLKLAWYPLSFLMFSAGIAAIATRKYDALAIVLRSPVIVDGREHKGPLPVVVPVTSNLGEINDAFKWLPGRDRQYVPRSEHLFKTLQPVLEDLLLLGRSYEASFDEFEVLLSLAHSDASDHGWGPTGRFGWKFSHDNVNNPFTTIVAEANKTVGNWGPLKAGLFDGSVERFTKAAASMREGLGRLGWW